jgi:large subunit ribosomal protein L18
MKNAIKKKHVQAKMRARRTRSNIRGTAQRPRLSVFRSSKHISVQLIDDVASKTLVSSSDKAVDAKGKKPVEVATLIGADIAKKAIAAGAKSVVFDRGSYLYHGRVKALAEAARSEGLEF